MWKKKDGLPKQDENEYKGLVCSVCHGRGLAESSRLEWEYRFPAILAGIFVTFAFFLLYFSKRMGVDPSQVLTFAGTIVGSITGFYFSGAKTPRSSTVGTGASITSADTNPKAPPGTAPISPAGTMPSSG
jgi:hypothetical protein